MAIAILTSRTSVSTLDKTLGINRHDIVHPVTYYTCPTGKRARVVGTVVCRDRGSAGTVNFLVADVVLFAWTRTTNINTLTNYSYLNMSRTLSTAEGGGNAKFDIVLEAGETLRTTQSSGVNAEIDFNAEVQELPL